MPLALGLQWVVDLVLSDRSFSITRTAYIPLELVRTADARLYSSMLDQHADERHDGIEDHSLRFAAAELTALLIRSESPPSEQMHLLSLRLTTAEDAFHDAPTFHQRISDLPYGASSLWHLKGTSTSRSTGNSSSSLFESLKKRFYWKA